MRKDSKKDKETCSASWQNIKNNLDFWVLSSIELPTSITTKKLPNNNFYCKQFLCDMEVHAYSSNTNCQWCSIERVCTLFQSNDKFYSTKLASMTLSYFIVDLLLVLLSLLYLFFLQLFFNFLVIWRYWYLFRWYSFKKEIIKK